MLTSLTFDIFPKPEKVFEEWLFHCRLDNGFWCQTCPYGRTDRDHTCFDISLKGDYDLWKHGYDMSKPLLRRYLGTYAWDKEE